MAAFLAFVSVTAFAQNVHVKRNAVCTASALTVTCTGSISGLGNGDVTVIVAFPNATATTICTSPGGNDAPGQNPAVPVNVSGSVTISPTKNGNLTWTLTTTPPAQPTSEQAGCANNNWTASINTISFGAGTAIFIQNNIQVLGPLQLSV
ncbi:hypothetical protein GCM10027034_10340 [Ramlibacter solisilvae]